MLYDVCIKHNVVLKFTKSYFGVTSIKFFGYIADGKGYRFEESRIQAIRDRGFPNTGKSKERQKYMQSILDSTNFIAPCYVHYQPQVEPQAPLWADLVAPLSDMTHNDFNWSDESTWKTDFRAEYQKLLDHLEWYAQHIEPRPEANTHKYLVRAKIGKSTGKSIIATLEADKGFLDRLKQVPIDNWDIHTCVYLESEIDPDNCTILRNHRARNL